MMSPTPFLDAFRIDAGDTVAIAGSGGKATLMYHLAHEALRRGLRVLTTSTTHLHPPTSQQSNGLYILEETPGWQEAIPEALGMKRHVTVVQGRPRPDKLRGLTLETLDRLHALCRPDLTLIKADGARNRPFKAPGPGEPVVPAWTTHGIVVAGLQGVGLSLDNRHVHRPERVAALTGLRPGDPLTAEAMARVVGHPDAYLRAFPPDARVALYLGWCEGAERHNRAERMAEALAPGLYSRIFCGSIAPDRQTITALR
jgi:probable selenium-dependent hydroxylase accessory protein YqeC